MWDPRFALGSDCRVSTQVCISIKTAKHEKPKLSGQGKVSWTGTWGLLQGLPKWSYQSIWRSSDAADPQDEMKHQGQSGIKNSEALKPQPWLDASSQTLGNYQAVMGSDIYISHKPDRVNVLFSQTQPWRQYLNNSLHADQPPSSPNFYREDSSNWEQKEVHAWPPAGPQQTTAP